MYRPNQITPIDKEYCLEASDLIVSKTDTASRITYVNDCFCRIAGYTYQELLGKPQNIIRHPCMPRAVFSLMWEHLKQEQEFLGYLRNMAKDGSYYWAFASIAPVYEDGEVVGYLSARRAPNPNALELVIPLYEKMRKLELSLPEDQQIPHSSALLWREISREYQSYAEFILAF